MAASRPVPAVRGSKAIDQNRTFQAFRKPRASPCGCDEQAFRQVLGAEVPWIEWPLSPNVVPDTPVILDLLEFCASAVGEPIQGAYHSYYRHPHLSWDRDAGLARFVADVNLLFRRNAVAYELTATGQARRLLPQVSMAAQFPAIGAA